MKPNTIIKILAVVLVLWGILGVMRLKIIPTTISLLGIGLLFKKEIFRIATVWFSIVVMTVSGLCIVGLILWVIPALLNNNLSTDCYPCIVLIGSFGILLGGFGYIRYLLCRRDIVEVFTK